jgi:hypothetical protein
MNFSTQFAEKGSYRSEHLLQYLDRWLDPWTEERASSRDYRLLFLDLAKSHLGDDVREFCWKRGYFLLYHYGCTTGVTQVNDTDLHGHFEKIYIEFEQTFFNDQQLIEPGFREPSCADC